MASTASNTILLRGDNIVKEGIANATIKPGYLVYTLSTGKIAKHAVAGGFAARAFALEADLLGVGNNPTIDTAYAAEDQMAYIVADAGCEIYALVAASAAAIVIGDLLESAGDGTLRKCTDVGLLTAAFGTADGTVADVTGAFSQSILNNNFADIAAKINALAAFAGKNVLARALEAVDNSANGASEARLRVEVI